MLRDKLNKKKKIHNYLKKEDYIIAYENKVIQKLLNKSRKQSENY